MDVFVDLLSAVTNALLWPAVLGLLALIAWTAIDLGAFAREALHRRHGADRLARTLARVAAAHDPNEALESLEQSLSRTVARNAFVARFAPMLGLAGTLIPLGPGLARLHNGNLGAFAEQLTIAFATTVAGIAVCGASYWIAGVRGRWYEADLRAVERRLEVRA